MSNQNLYFRTQLETKVSILPSQMDSNIDEHLFTNLKNSIKGKVIENGVVIDVMKILDYDYGTIDPTNFMTTVIYPVKYECFLCSPIKDLEITCIIESFIKGYIIAKNGPLVIVISYNVDESKKFTITDNNVVHIEKNKILSPGDYIRVRIINFINNISENNITSICKLVDLASSSEISKFKKEQSMIIGEIDNNDNKEFI